MSFPNEMLVFLLIVFTLKVIAALFIIVPIYLCRHELMRELGRLSRSFSRGRGG